jgi:hypothetical protein
MQSLRKALATQYGITVNGKYRWWTVSELLSIARKAVEAGVIE